MKKKVYLDYAAATPMDKSVLAVMGTYFTELFYNPSALYLDSKKVAEALDMSRKSVAKWLGVRSSEIVFTAGGTEANNLAIHGVMNEHSQANMLVSAIEHESVLKPASQYKCDEIRVDEYGTINIDDLRRKINDNTLLVSIMYANNEIGTIQPLAKAATVLNEIRGQRIKTGNRLPIYLHTDACQAPNYLSLQISRLGVDMMTLNGGKIYGPKQSGVLYVGSHVLLKPIITGGGQEYGLRAGTQNVPSIIGFSAALDMVQSRRQKESLRMGGLQKSFLEHLDSKLPQALVNGTLKSRLVNNVNVLIPGHDNERLVMALDEAGVQCASGSACSALKGEPSRVLQAIGRDDQSARSSLRFSMGMATDEADILFAVNLLSEIVA